MSKQISPRELATIVSALLINPDLLGELAHSDQHKSFMLAIGQVVGDFCGGEAFCIGHEDVSENYLSDQYSSPYLCVAANDSLPSYNRNVWSWFDPAGWDDDNDEDVAGNDPLDIEVGEPLLPNEIATMQQSLKALMHTF